MYGLERDTLLGVRRTGARMAKLRSAVLAAALVIFLGSAALAAPPTLCAPAESTLFSCSTGTDIVSVCGSAVLSTTSGALQYRFGRAKPGPDVHPAEGVDWRPLTHAGSWMFSGGGGAWMSFANPPYRYIVYTAVGRGWHAKAGVVVNYSGRRVAIRRCKGAPISELGPALFERAGLADDGDDFRLP